MTLRDMAKIGQMMLNEGAWNGRQIISEEWIDLCTRKHTPERQHAYGFMFHLNKSLEYFPVCDDAYMAIGSGDQIICVIPSQKIVFAATCSSYQSKSLTPVILKRLSKYVIEKLAVL